MTPSLTTSCRTYNIALRNVRIGGILIFVYHIAVVVRCHRPLPGVANPHMSIVPVVRYYCQSDS